MSLASRSSGPRVFAARARRERLRRLLMVLGLIAVAAAVGLLVWLFGWSSVLAVEDVAVVGADDDLEIEVLEVAQAPVGTPLAMVDTGAIGERIRQLPEIAEAEVNRSWPNTLTLEVTLREPLAAIFQPSPAQENDSSAESGGIWWRVDESGVVFGESEARPESLPVLDAPVGAAERATRAAGVAVLAGLPAPVLDLAESVVARSPADIRLVLRDGGTVTWGTADRIEQKAAVLLALIDAQEEPVSEYDVSAPDHPAVTP